MIRRAAAATAFACLLACQKGAAPEPAPAAGGAPSAAAAGTAGGPVGTAYVSAVTTLRREPTDASRVRGPKKELPNQLALLLRGEKVAVLEAREDWARVRTSDDTEGWLHRATLLEGEGITQATVLAPADVFDRPDLLAANAKRRIEPGTLLLVVKTKPPFSEVNVSSGPNAWVLSERLASGDREVSVAKLAEKARWLKKSGKDEDAKQILALARQQFAGVPLVDALAVELGEAPPPAPPGAGAAGPAAGAATPGTTVVPTSTSGPIDPSKP